jgi:hypothetical protein
MDVTADVLFERFGRLAFRLNLDLWRDYLLVLRPNRWEIANPAGLKITSESATHCFWWKAQLSRAAKRQQAPAVQQDDSYLAAEVRYVFHELYGWFLRRGLVVGNPPDFHNRLGKLAILEMASSYFRTPCSAAGWNLPQQIEEFRGRGVIAKSLSSEPFSDDRVLYTTSVGYDGIDRRFPWFLQTKVDALQDVTIVVCGGQFFAFARSRKDLDGLDWRRTVGDEDPEQTRWHHRVLSDAERASLRGLCRELGVNWGRFDFLEDEDGLVFLEYNANGQWGFLDFWGRNGLTDAVVSYLLTAPAAVMRGALRMPEMGL